MATGDDHHPDWIPRREAARRLHITPDALQLMAKIKGIPLVARGGRLGVEWSRLEPVIGQTRGGRPPDGASSDDGHRPPGALLMASVKARFGWTDRELAERLGVSQSRISRYRVKGVPDDYLPKLRDLARTRAVRPSGRRPRPS